MLGRQLLTGALGQGYDRFAFDELPGGGSHTAKKKSRSADCWVGVSNLLIWKANVPPVACVLGAVVHRERGICGWMGVPNDLLFAFSGW